MIRITIQMQEFYSLSLNQRSKSLLCQNPKIMSPAHHLGSKIH